MRQNSYRAGDLADHRSAVDHLRALMAERPPDWQQRFEPAVVGLESPIKGTAFDATGRPANSRRFLGWSVGLHWLLLQQGRPQTARSSSIRRWWNQMGRARFPHATRLLITADAGGSNGHRVRAWKWHLAQLAAETGLDITVAHYPPGTSKWNRIEHRMFSFITMNWRGRPLTSIRTVIELISATATSTGLTIQAAHDTGWYPKGVKITDTQLAALPLHQHTWHGDWNYTLNAQSNQS